MISIAIFFYYFKLIFNKKLIILIFWYLNYFFFFKFLNDFGKYHLKQSAFPPHICFSQLEHCSEIYFSDIYHFLIFLEPRWENELFCSSSMYGASWFIPHYFDVLNYSKRNIFQKQKLKNNALIFQLEFPQN